MTANRRYTSTVRESGPWSTQRILDALASLDEATLGVDVIDVRTAEYRLLRYPERFVSPTLPAAQVIRSHTSRSLDTVFDEIAGQVKGWGLDVLHWWVSSATRPLQTEAFLVARGGVVSDSHQIVARELYDDDFDRAPSALINVELVRDERTLRDAMAVETEGWGRSRPDEDAIALRLSETLDNFETSSEFQFVAYVGAQPASTGCCKINGEVGRLYGAVTLREFRSRGCYLAVLSSRLRQLRDCGATIAITRARPLTSGRLLMKVGFSAHDLASCYRVSLS